MPDQNVSVIIPVYNEEAMIKIVINEVRAVISETGTPYEIIVVDDGSTDSSLNTALESDVRVFKHTQNFGYGAALKTGILNAKQDRIIIIDSDGTYPVDKIPKIIDHLDSFDMVVGARIGENVHIPFMNGFAKMILITIGQYITGRKIPDLNSGLRGFHKDTAEHFLPLLPDGFSLTSSITVAMLSQKYKVEYIPIDYYPRREGKSKIHPLNFFSFVLLLIRLCVLFNLQKLFFSMGLLFITIGLAFLGPHIGSVIEDTLSCVFPQALISSGFLLFCALSILSYILGAVTYLFNIRIDLFKLKKSGRIKADLTKRYTQVST